MPEAGLVSTTCLGIGDWAPSAVQRMRANLYLSFIALCLCACAADVSQSGLNLVRRDTLAAIRNCLSGTCPFVIPC